MKNAEELLESTGETLEYARQYLHQQGEYIRLEAAERVSKVFSALATALVLAFFASLVLVMLSVAVALWIGGALDSLPAGFLLVSGAYLVLALVLFLMRQQLLTNPVLSLILDAFFEDEKEAAESAARNNGR